MFDHEDLNTIEGDSEMQQGDERPERGNRGSLWSSFRSAGAGWRQALHSERNLKIHLLATAIVCLLCWILRLSRIDVCLVVVSVALVWITELLNTAIERVVDLVSPEHSVPARDAKDISAAAVLTAAVGAVAIGLLVFGPPVVRACTAALERF
jgi:diacylglycerol kinase